MWALQTQISLPSPAGHTLGSYSMDPELLHVDSEDWSDRADTQADVSLLGVHVIWWVLLWSCSILFDPVMWPSETDIKVGIRW